MSSTQKVCIYLVDDDEDDLFLAQMALRKSTPNCQIKTFTDGQQVLDSLVQTSDLPQLILLDINMPILNGLEVLRRIREQPAWDSLSVVMLTTSDQSSDRQRAAALKANDYITKPYSVDDLTQIMHQLQKKWLH